MTDLGLSPYLRLIGKVGSTRHLGGLSASDTLLSRANIQEKSRVLDIGCGAGHTSAHIAKTYGCQVIGVDISLQALDAAAALYKDEPYFDLLTFELGDISCLPFSDAYFDIVVCESVLIFVNEKRHAIAEMYRVLKPQGYLLLNELCVKDHAESEDMRTYFSRPELGAHLAQCHDIIGAIKDTGLDLQVTDIRSFDIKGQIVSDLKQFSNKRGLWQLLEFAHLLLTEKEMRQDMIKLLRSAIDWPHNATELLEVVLILGQRKP